MIAFPLTIFAASSVADSHDPIIETWHTAIEARDGQRLRLVIANEGQPALLFKSVAGAWDWAATSKLSIPVENPGDEALTLSLRIDSDPDRSLSGKVAIAPHSAGDLAIWIDAPSPRAMGMIAGPSAAAAGLEAGTLPMRRPTAQSMPHT